MHATSTNLGLRPGTHGVVPLTGVWGGAVPVPRTGGLAGYAAGFFVGLVMGGLAVHGLPSSGGEGAFTSDAPQAVACSEAQA